MSIHVSYVTYIHTQLPTYTHVLVFIKGDVPLNIVCGCCVGQNGMDPYTPYVFQPHAVELQIYVGLGTPSKYIGMDDCKTK